MENKEIVMQYVKYKRDSYHKYISIQYLKIRTTFLTLIPK